MSFSPPQTPPKPRLHPGWILGGFAFVVVAARLLFLFLTRLTFEDSLISLRYAENLATGRGFIYNPGEPPVFGASTPLYVLLLAGITKVGLAPLAALFTAKMLAVTADVATLLLWCRWLRRETDGWAAPAVFALLFGLSPIMVPVSISGMETSFAMLLLSLPLLWELEDRNSDWKSGLLLGLLVLVRPDGAIAGALFLGLRWLRTRRLPWQAALTAAAVVLPWVLFATWYFGSPIPHSIPAKAAAYNAHIRSAVPNFFGTLAEMAPVRPSPWSRLVMTTPLMLLLGVGAATAWKSPRLRVLALLWLVWWAYLVVPRTLLFTWYFPLLLLPAYGLAALGAGCLPRLPIPTSGRWQPFRKWAPPVVGTVLAVGTVLYLAWGVDYFAKTQTAEVGVRVAIGKWLRRNTPEDARVAMEPIGYIGYYSGRRILDEVGLVSPEMVPLNRQGDGWFAEMLRRLAPEWIVERPAYLLRNQTLNSRVQLFRTQEERIAFVARYEPVATFGDTRVPRSLLQNYRFVIYHRRDTEAARRWEGELAALSPEAREIRIIRAMVGADL